MATINQASEYNPLSANTLFHFTGSMLNIKGILANGFYPRYSLENHSDFFTGIKLLEAYNKRAIPMVCFCDIPLSQIRKHIKTYGGYAIGLSKSWGIAKRISPVMYTLSNSSSLTAIKNSFKSILEQLLQKELDNRSNISGILSNEQQIAPIINSLDSLVCFSKIYEGELWRQGELISKAARFYDEREWRYVPDFMVLHKHELPFNMPEHIYSDINEKRKLEVSLAKLCKVSFNSKDIKYIIVSMESEILQMIDIIRSIPRFKQDGTELLTTKIISLEQILDDF